MQVLSDIKHLPSRFAKGSVVTLGNFDGVHLGHQRLIQSVVNAAREHGLPAVVVTFEPHPLHFFQGKSAPSLLMPLSRKLECLAECGPDAVVVLPFTGDLAALAPEDFVREILVERLRLKQLFVGYDYAFGRGRRGNAQLLAKLGEAHGFTVEQLEPVFAEGGIVSSTRIRQEILDGDVDEAAFLLGRLHSVEGLVAHGFDRGGKLLGFPTANLHIHEHLLLPKPGVYAVRAELAPVRKDGNGYSPFAGKSALLRGVTNVGSNPTFGLNSLRVETHLLDFSQNIYDAPLRVHFAHRLRDERAFSQISDLVEQIRRDVERAYDILC